MSPIFANGAVTAALAQAVNGEEAQKREAERAAQEKSFWERYADGLESRWNDSGPGKLFNSLNRSVTWSVGLGGGAEVKLFSPGFDFQMGGGVAMEGVYSPEGSYGRLQSDFSVLQVSIEGLAEGSIIDVGQTDTFTANSYSMGTLSASSGSFEVLKTSPSAREWGAGIHAGIVKFSLSVDLDKF